MRLVINGEERSVSNVITLMDLLHFYQLENKILVIELNRIIVDRDQYEHTKVSDDDRIEIVHFVGGG